MFPPFAPVPGQNPIMQAYDGLPVGVVMAYAGGMSQQERSNAYVNNTAKANANQPLSLIELGWLVCDGSSLKIADYLELYMVLGNIYGGDDTNFNLPNYQGQFLRGVYTQAPKNGEVVDNIEKSSQEKRKLPKEGKGQKDGVGSIQASAIQDHEHNYMEAQPTAAGGEGVAAKPGSNNTSKITEIPTGNVSKTETRATNTFVYFIIKYRNLVQYQQI